LGYIYTINQAWTSHFRTTLFIFCLKLKSYFVFFVFKNKIDKPTDDASVRDHFVSGAEGVSAEASHHQHIETRQRHEGWGEKPS
jgi:hypothetical protein